MTDRRSSTDLGPNVEAALGAFPFPERDWESGARAVEARLSESTRGSTDTSLLAAPLPSEPDEPLGVSATATPLTSSGVRPQSLADLARRSVEKKQQSTREMARESLAIAAQQRPSEVRGLREPSNGAPLSATVPAAVSRVTQASVPVAPAAAANAWPKLALALPVVALAAAVALWLRRPEPTPLVTSVLPVATSDAKSGAAASPALVPGTGNPPPAPHGVDPSTLPGEPAAAKAVEGAHANANAKPAGAPAAASPVTPPPSAAQKIELEDEPAPVAAAPEKPIEKSLPPDPALRPADSRSGELAAKPSTGAVQAALGAVMSGARRCVAGDDAPSSAVVVFGSDGRVQRVSVSGPAAGQASGACIEAQLGRARVQPFAASTFSVNATVRP